MDNRLIFLIQVRDGNIIVVVTNCPLLSAVALVLAETAKLLKRLFLYLLFFEFKNSIQTLLVHVFIFFFHVCSYWNLECAAVAH